MAAGKRKPKMSLAQDRALDRKMGIREGSPRDNALDRKRGVPVGRGQGRKKGY